MRLPLAIGLESRDGTLAKDAQLVNAIAFGATLEKRPGTARSSNSTEVGAGGPMICYAADLFAVVGKKLVAI